MKPDSLPARLFRKYIEKEKQFHREKPTRPFVGEKKQMWYFLMNQVDRTPPEQDGGSEKTEQE